MVSIGYIFCGDGDDDARETALTKYFNCSRRTMHIHAGYCAAQDIDIIMQV